MGGLRHPENFHANRNRLHILATAFPRPEGDERPSSIRLNLYVAVFGLSLTVNELVSLFSRYGEIRAIELEKSGAASRHFNAAFVEMSDVEQAQVAILALNGKSFDGRTLIILPALRRFGIVPRRVGH